MLRQPHVVSDIRRRERSGGQATCALLGQICKRYQGETNSRLQAIQLHRGQELILAELWQQDGLTPSELAERLLVQPATITNALQAMERSGMVERRRASHDQRVVQVFLTDPGRASRAAVEAIFGFVFDGSAFIIGGHKLAQSRKYRNVSAGNRKVSLILDDLASVDPWTPRGIKVHGVAAAESRVGQFGPGDYLIVRPATSWSWGIEGESFRGGRFQPHKTIWAASPGAER